MRWEHIVIKLWHYQWHLASCFPFSVWFYYKINVAIKTQKSVQIFSKYSFLCNYDIKPLENHRVDKYLYCCLKWSLSSDVGRNVILVMASQVYEAAAVGFCPSDPSWLMFFLEVFHTDGSPGCLWSRAVSRFSPPKIFLCHSKTWPIFIRIQVVCVCVGGKALVYRRNGPVCEGLMIVYLTQRYYLCPVSGCSGWHAVFKCTAGGREPSELPKEGWCISGAYWRWECFKFLSGRLTLQ